MKLMRKYIIFFFSVISILCGCLSCTRTSEKEADEATAMPVLMQGDSKWSFYGADGIFQYEDSIDGVPSLVINGIYSLQNPDGTYSLWRAGEKPELVEGCDRLISVGWNNDNLIPVCRPGSRISVIDPAGRKKFEIGPVDGAEIMETSIAFHDGYLMIITTDGKYGYVDKSGKVVIKPRYYAAANFGEGRAMVEIPGKRQSDHRLYRFIGLDGATLFDIPDSIRLETFRYHDGRVVARTVSGRVGFLEDDGRFSPALPQADGVGNYNKRYYAFVARGKWGVASFDGDIHIEPAYQTIEMLPDQSFLVQDAMRRYHVLDRNGIEKFDFEGCSYVSFARGFGFICKSSGGTYLLNKNGRRDTDRVFAKVSLNRSASKVVRSQWYNPSDIYAQLRDKISPYGVDKFKIGMPAYVFFQGDPTIEHLVKYFEPQLFQDGNTIKFGVRVISDRPLVRKIPGRSEGSEYEFDKNAVIKIVQIDISMEHDSWRSGQIDFANTMRNKGYSLVKAVERNGVSYRLYKAMDNEMLVFYSEPQKRVRIYVLDEDTAVDIKRSVFEGAPGIPDL